MSQRQNFSPSNQASVTACEPSAPPPPEYQAAPNDVAFPPPYNPQFANGEAVVDARASFEAKNQVVENMAPPPYYDPNNRGLEHLSYDQVVKWWNKLSEDQRNKMKMQGCHLSTANLQQLRTDYQKYYPKEYYLKEIYSKDQASASDYYLLYYLCDEMAREKKYTWLTSAFRQAFEIPPPVYEEGFAPPSYEEADRWWNQLSEEKKRTIQNTQLQPGQIAIIRREYAPYYRFYDQKSYSKPQLYFYDYYLMSRYPSRFYSYPIWTNNDFILFETMREGFQLTSLAVRSAYEVTKFTALAVWEVGKAAVGCCEAIGSNALSSGGGGSSGGSRNSGSNGGSGTRDCKNAFLAFLVGLAIIAGIIAAAASAVVGAIYAGVKATKSFFNLVPGNTSKLVRSLWRLGCIIGGAYVGTVKGLLVGAMVGSMVPGIGTTAGAIIGAIFGAPITAALAGAFAKYTAQIVSWWNHRDDPNLLSATNPDKWNIEKTEASLRANAVVMDTGDIKKMLVALKAQKKQFQTLTGNLPGTEANTEKAERNEFLKAIKKGYDPREGIRVGPQVRYMWSAATNQILKEKAAIPKPIGLTR